MVDGGGRTFSVGADLHSCASGQCRQKYPGVETGAGAKTRILWKEHTISVSAETCCNVADFVCRIARQVVLHMNAHPPRVIQQRAL